MTPPAERKLGLESSAVGAEFDSPCCSPIVLYTSLNPVSPAPNAPETLGHGELDGNALNEKRRRHETVPPPLVYRNRSFEYELGLQQE